MGEDTDETFDADMEPDRDDRDEADESDDSAIFVIADGSSFLRPAIDAATAPDQPASTETDAFAPTPATTGNETAATTTPSAAGSLSDVIDQVTDAYEASTDALPQADTGPAALSDIIDQVTDAFERATDAHEASGDAQPQAATGPGVMPDIIEQVTDAFERATDAYEATTDAQPRPATGPIAMPGIIDQVTDAYERSTDAYDQAPAALERAGEAAAQAAPAPTPPAASGHQRPLLSPNGQRGPLSGAIWPDYKIGDLLGQGAMATVYLAERVSDGGLVALKVLPGHHADDPVFRQRLELEAEAAGSIHHDNVAGVYTAGKYGDTYFLEMELIEGGSLQERIAARHTAREPFTVAEICTFGIHLAQALAAAHEAGLVHRDVKPGNLLLTTANVGKLADFGIVKVLGEQSLTMTGSSVGTPSYMSPEQARGGEIDIRSDIYAAGVLLYELTSFHVPFEGDSADALIYQHNFGEATLLTEHRSDCPPDLQAVIFTCMQKKPERRYDDPDLLRQDLEAVRDGQAVSTWLATARKVELGGKEALREIHGRPWLRHVALALVCLVVVVVAASWWNNRQQHIDSLQRRLAQIDAAAPVPPKAGALLDELAGLIGEDDEDIRRWRDSLHRIESNRSELDRLAAQTPLDWQLQQDADLALRELIADCSSNDPTVQAWGPINAARERQLNTLRDRLRILDSVDQLTAGILDELTPDLAAIARLQPPTADERQRWEAIASQLRARINDLRQAIAAHDQERALPKTDRPQLQALVDQLRSLSGDHDPDVQRGLNILEQSRQAERRLRGRCARLDQGNHASHQAIAASRADLAALTAIVGGDDPDVSRWNQRISESATAEDRLAASLMAMAEDATMGRDQQERFATALAELAAIRGDEHEQIVAWRTLLDGQQRELAGLQSLLQPLRDKQLLSHDEQQLLGEALPRLMRYGVLDAATAHHMEQRIQRSAAHIASLRRNLADYDQVAPRNPERQATLQQFISLAGTDDPDAKRWQAKASRIETLHQQLSALDRRQRPPADTAAMLVDYSALVGPLDPDAQRWQDRLARIAFLRSQLTVIDDGDLPPETAGDQLAALAELIGDDDPDLRRWQERVQGCTELRLWLPSFELGRILLESDLTMVERCHELLGDDHDYSRRADQRLAELDPPAPAWASQLTRDGYGLQAQVAVGTAVLNMRWIPPGSFTLGSPIDEADRDDDEAQVEITISEGYWLAEREFPQALFGELMGRDPSPVKADDMPVQRVSWHDAHACAAELSARTGITWRLPTEAEWEYACRAGNHGPWPGEGDNPRSALHPWAWTADTSDGQVHPSGRLLPNDLGCHDMLGNLWEWCDDRYGAYPERPTSDPLGTSGKKRVLRGGSFADALPLIRAANRASLSPDASSEYVGFRLAISRQNIR